MPTHRVYQPKSGNIGIAIVLTEEEKKAQAEAIKKAPRINNLSEPYVTDNGRTFVYFKAGDNVAEKAAQFEERRSKVFAL